MIVDSEYNHSISGAQKNALDYLKPELQNKAAGLVGYGAASGARAIEHLRAILSEMEVAHVRNSVLISLFTDFKDFTVFEPTAPVVDSVMPMLDQLLVWSKAMQTARSGDLVGASA